MKQQTAIEWLINEMSKTRDYQRVINEVNQSSTSVRDLIAEAKEIEKEQIIEAANYGCDEWMSLEDRYRQGELYYNETYEN